MTAPTRRRTFLQMVAAILAGANQLWAGSLKRLVPNRQEKEAAAKARRQGVGTVTLDGPERVQKKPGSGQSSGP